MAISIDAVSVHGHLHMSPWFVVKVCIASSTHPIAWCDAKPGTAGFQDESLNVSSTPTRFAFYGRCSTEDIQDPRTSRAWQRGQAEVLVGTDSVIVAEFFDIGFSRSIPWARRPEAGRLLEMLGRSRDWDAVVVGEGQRCFYGTQFADMSAVFEHYRVPLWIPELGGRYDSSNPSHDILMSVTAGLGKVERQRIQQRVRLAMAAQARTEGRWLGGRPPYGYCLVDAGPHPHPDKARNGIRLHRLEIVPEHADVVREIFTRFLAGLGVRAIAANLNERGIPCPSAADAARNPHRTREGWQPSTVLAILRNATYTGYINWGRTRTREVLVNPRNPSLGHRQVVVPDPEGVAKSQRASHRGVVTEEQFTRAQQKFEANAMKAPAGRVCRGARASHSDLLLQGILTCAHCGKRMEGNLAGNDVRYRCRDRSVRRTEPHPPLARVMQSEVRAQLDPWISALAESSSIQNELRQQLLTDTQLDQLVERAIDNEDQIRTAARKILTGDPIAAEHEVRALQAEGFRLSDEVRRQRFWRTEEYLDRWAAAISGPLRALPSAPSYDVKSLYGSVGLLVTFDAVHQRCSWTLVQVEGQA